MKTKLTLTFFIAATFMTGSLNLLKAQNAGSVEMGAQYANEVFYSLTNGEVKVSARNIWDIAFYSNAFSAGIIINDGAGVELYTYPKSDNTGWETFDTTGFVTWKKMYNDASDWENGAFNRYQKGHPDYGWGIYSMTSHDVIGDSLYLIKTPDGTLRKLNIVRKYSTLNKYEIRYALLDGQQDQTVTLDVNPYTDRAFMAYSFVNGIIDREPAKAEWDILFTRYYGVVQNTPYPVVGVLLNPEVDAARVSATDPAFTDWTDLDFETGKDVIGYDWKYFDMNTFQFVVEDSLLFFVKAQEGGVYKLVFTGFSGSSTGISTFTTNLLSPLGMPEISAGAAHVFPNPTNGKVTIRLDGMGSTGEASLFDLSGRLMKQWSLDGNNTMTVDLGAFNRGSYILKVGDNEKMTVNKVVLVK